MTAGSLFVLADAAPTTGVGHHVRSSALAVELASRGWQITVATQPDTVDWVVDEVRSRGWTVCDDTDGDPLTVLTTAATATPGRSVLLVDTYRVDSERLAVAREGFPGIVVVIDDLADRILHADVVVNQNVGAEDLEVLADPGTLLLLGLRYVLLRPEITAARPSAAEVPPAMAPRRVLVVMGGTDPTGSAPAIALGCSRALPDAEVLVVAPDGAVAQGARLRSVPRIESMAHELLRADLVVTAAGSTLWEAFCLGRPVAAVQVAANQAQVYSRLVADGTVIGLGSAPTTADHVATVLSKELSTPDVVLHLARAGARMVDGHGAQRVADEIERVTERREHARG